MRAEETPVSGSGGARPRPIAQAGKPSARWVAPRRLFLWGRRRARVGGGSLRGGTRRRPTLPCPAATRGVPAPRRRGWLAQRPLIGHRGPGAVPDWL